MLCSPTTELLLHGQDEVFQKDGDPVLPTLAITDDDFTALELDVLDPQAQSLHEPHAGTVEETRDESLSATHLLEEPANLRPSLRLGRGRDVTAHRKVTQKATHFARTELRRMTLAMKEHEAPNPVHTGLLGPIGVVQGSNDVTNLVEELDSAGRGRRAGWTKWRGGATIRRRHLGYRPLVHARIYGLPMQHVARPLEGREGCL